MADAAAWLARTSQPPPAPVAAPTGTSPAVSAWLSTAGVDAGPEARRARGGGSPSQPRPVAPDDVQLQPNQQVDPLSRIGAGIAAGPQPGQATVANALDVAPSQADIQRGIDFTREHGRPPDVMEVDTGAQMLASGIPLGGAARMAAPLLSPLIGPVLTRLGLGAGTGAAQAKSMGGDPKEGAALGALFSLPGAAGDYAMGAAARKAGRRSLDVVQGETNATKRTADKITARAGEDNAALDATINELPALDKALSTQAQGNPGATAKVVRTTLNELAGHNDAAFEAIQKQRGGFPLGDLVQRMNKVAQKAKAEGHAVTQDAANATSADLLERYGYEGKWTPDMKLTAEQVRNIRNDLQDVAFKSNQNVRPGKQESAMREVYRAYNEAIEDAAKGTQGLDLDAFKARNRQISTLIPVERALTERAMGEARGSRSLRETIQAATPALIGSGMGGIEGTLYGLGGYAAAKGLSKGARLLDYQLAQRYPNAQPPVYPTMNDFTSVGRVLSTGAATPDQAETMPVQP